MADRRVIGEGDKIVVRQPVQGTHTGTFQHIAPTGKTISNPGMAVYQLRDGKIINAQAHTDRLGFLQQLNVLPADLTSLSSKKVYLNPISFIDQFSVPAAAKDEFYQRMRTNRNFIKTLPGFIEDAVYEHSDATGNLICMTVARWESPKAVEQAKEAVQAEYKKQGFNLAQWVEQPGITMERALYREVEPGN